jgi:truncated hemoglobin YjbI
VQQDAVLRPLFPGKTLTCAIEAFAAFLIQFLGGPRQDSQRRWWLSLSESHGRFAIAPQHREAWMQNMVKALDDARIAEPAHSALLGFFEHTSSYMVDHQAGSANLHPELARRWLAQRALDGAVAAVRSGDAGRAITLAAQCDGSVFTGLLALMLATGHPTLLEYVHEQLRRDPALAQQRYAGWTLLHNAAGAGRLATVELLLSLGADPNALDGGKHTPLYSLGNECAGAECAEVVRALARGGAELNANDGVCRCTALHMAARRGNTAAAEALLDCGADINARDRRGDTPLQRAVNCRKVEVAALLRVRGAK